MTKSVFIKTYGCQMNVYDSARMADVLAPLGYAPVDEPDDAEIVILNTCHIREKAAEKVYSELGRLKRLKLAKARRGERLLIAVAGCVAQAEGEEIRRRAPQVDMVFGPQAYHRLPAMLAQLDRAGGAVLDTEFDVAPKFDALPEESVPPGFSAFVTVQEGCDKFCTFCVVPYTRGAEYSRPPAAIEAEARRLVARGAVELTLLGQNVNAYHGRDGGGKEAGLASLIRRLAAIRGIERIRYTTSHPRDVDEALIAVHGEEHKLMPFLHLPVQAGSDRILAAMNRGYGAAEYLDVVARLRRARPDIALSSDFIVGFPGESEADFAATIELVEAVGFASAYSFKYSPRPGTPAAARDDQVADDVKEDRLQRLQALLRRQQDAFNRAMAGRVISVLIEGEGRHAGQLVGRSPYMQPVHLCAPRELIGALRDVRIDTVHPHSLSGSLVGGDERIAAAATAEALR